MLANRCRKRFQHLRRVFERENVGAFRVYDWDIPEIRALVDWYEGHLVVAEYERLQTESVHDWLGAMARAVGEALAVRPECVHLKRRHTRPASGHRYERIARTETRLPVREGDVRFLVNLEDRVDTGLFPDHRITRRLVREDCRGRTFLNLCAYTGAFTCHAAKGGATASESVDASRTYLAWARDNLALNGFASSAHALVEKDVEAYLADARRRRRTFDVVLLDPPSFWRGAGDRELELQRDHRRLLEETLEVVAPGGVLWFSTSHQRFEPELADLPAREITDLTERTTPEDFRRTPHRCWRLAP
jgi:23S rRNA G2069 N7-methylase RlmK/C1962 C5-methylase RlmI